LRQGLPINLNGLPGVGKTTLAIYLAQTLGRSVLFVQGHASMTIDDLVGGYRGYQYHKVVDNFIRDVLKIDERAETRWSSGWLTKAIVSGQTVVFDEFNRVPPEVQTVLLSVLQENILPITRLGHTENISVDPEFRLIVTSGATDQPGIFPILEPLMDRLVTIPLDVLDEETEVEIVTAHSEIPVEESRQIVRLFRRIHQIPKKKSVEKGSAHSSVRTSIILAQLVKSQGWSLVERRWPEEFSSIVRDLSGLHFSLADIERQVNAEPAATSSKHPK
jgi:gas vesicle protein GvpN